MLSCKEVKDLLSAYYDGELGVAASKQIEEHLDVCADCRRELEDIERLSGEIKSLEFPAGDEAFAASLSAALASQVQKSKKNPGSIWYKMRPYAAVAACFVIAAGIYTAQLRGYIIPNNTVEPVKVGDAENTPAPAKIANENINTDENVDKVSEKTPEPTAKVVTDYLSRLMPEEQNKNENSKPAPTPVMRNISEDKTADTDAGSVEEYTEPADVSAPAEETALPSAPPDTNEETITSVPEATPIPAAGYSTTEGSSGGGPVASGGSGGGASAMPAGGGGGGSSSGATAIGSGITVRFKLVDAAQKDKVHSILSNYGNVSEGDGYMKVRVLAANYDAALATVRSIGALSELSVSGESGAYGFIEIEYEKTAE